MSLQQCSTRSYYSWTVRAIAFAACAWIGSASTAFGQQGPPIKFQFHDNIRHAMGKVMDRVDVFENGWHDGRWVDHRTGQVHSMPYLPAVGRSCWNGNGPTIPASANCASCHSIQTVAQRDCPDGG